MDKREHKRIADEAAAKIEHYMDKYPDSFSVRVYGSPPTISLQLSVIGAHHLIDAINGIDS
jgi:hypothetical protein